METNEFFDQFEKYLNENHIDFVKGHKFSNTASYFLKFGKIVTRLTFDYENKTIFEYSYSIVINAEKGQEIYGGDTIKDGYFQTGDRNFYLDTFEIFESKFLSNLIERSKRFNKSFEEISAKLDSCRDLFRDMGLSFENFIETKL